jgi:FkbM family methyltransferase
VRVGKTTADDDRQFLRLLYSGILGREADEAGLNLYLGKLANGEIDYPAAVSLFLNSGERTIRDRCLIDSRSDDLRLFAGYSPSDLTIFDEFHPKDLKPAPGFVTDYTGSRMRLSLLWRGVQHLDNRVLPIPDPCDHFAHTTEWLGTLKAVKSAGERFAAMELGAGPGPWIAASGVAAKNKGIRDVYLMGVEADPGRFENMKINLKDNGLEAELLQAAVGVEAGHARWPKLHDPNNEAGNRPVRSENGIINADDLAYLGQSVTSREMIDVQIIPFAEMLDRQKVWDLIHIDIQGTEAEICRAEIDRLDKQVRCLVIGTHSRKLDGDVMEIFGEGGWCLEHEVPTRLRAAPQGGALIEWTTHDGTQVWSNPRFARVGPTRS